MTSSIAAIHVAKKHLGLDDDTYRAKLANITGKVSVKDMTETERQAVLTVFRNEGFKPATGSRRPDGRRELTGKYAGKLQALWIAGYNLGIIVERADSAMIAFIKRQAKVDDTRFLNEQTFGRKAVEGLKMWLAREGGVDWSTMRLAPPWMKSPGCRVARAQWAKLNPAGKADFWAVVTDLIDQDPTYRELKDREWITVMNYFGECIRKEKAGA